MIEFFSEWAAAVWGVLADSGPWLLLGLAVAGVLKEFLPEEKVFRYLGKDDLRSVTIAAVAGAPLPLCSCSVVPAAIALQRAGASKSATTSFLIATPETGADSVGTTWALMDPVMTIARPIAAVLTAILSGSAVAALVKSGKVDPTPIPTAVAEASCCHASRAAPVAAGKPGIGRRLLNSLKYGYGPLSADLAPWFLLGFALAGLITVLVPDAWFGESFPIGWPAMLAMLVAGLPMYVCATASTPIAAALIAKGLNPGAALVFLLAGPATNIATIGIVKKFLGTRVLITYLISIAAVALALGATVDALYPALGLTPTVSVGDAHEHRNALSVLAGIALGLLMIGHTVSHTTGRNPA
ncbi:MAG: SO_0444 family Cu/Zn efflux transporter [Planctomycetota bacterium]|nr:SO_0444 family Cu/Zn efflux transporter [Planctomycetota bacterium]